MHTSRSRDEKVQKNKEMRSQMQNSLTLSIYNGQMFQAKRLIASQLADLNETDSWWLLMRKKKEKLKAWNRNSLMYCSMIENDSISYSIGQQLVESEAKLSMLDSNHFSCLMYACLYERAFLVKLFLTAVYDIQILTVKDKKHGLTVFHLASLGKNQNICHNLNKFAVKKFNLNIDLMKNAYGHTPFDLCKLNKHEECMKLHGSFKPNSRLNQNSFSSFINLPTYSGLESKMVESEWIFELPDRNTGSLASMPTYQESLSLNENLQTSNELLEMYKKQYNHFKPALISWLTFYQKLLTSYRENMIPNRESEPDTWPKVVEESIDPCEIKNRFEIVRKVIPRGGSTTSKSSMMRRAERASLLHSALSTDRPSAADWKHEVSKIFDALQQERTKSFRRPFIKLPTPTPSNQPPGSSMLLEHFENEPSEYQNKSSFYNALNGTSLATSETRKSQIANSSPNITRRTSLTSKN